MVGEKDGVHVEHLTHKTDEARADVFDKDEPGGLRFDVDQPGKVSFCN